MSRRRPLSPADAVTLGNGALGASALVLVADALVRHPDSAPGIAVVEAAAVLVVLAGILDGVDGLVARRFGSSTAGARLDAVCDLLTFGAVPALVLAARDAPRPPMWAGLGIVLAGAYVCAAAFRLVRHLRSLDVNRCCFRGLPMPSAAAASTAAVLAAPSVVVQLGLVAGICVLMVARVPYPRPTRGTVPAIAAAVAVLALAVAGAIPVRWVAAACLATVPLIPVLRHMALRGRIGIRRARPTLG